MNITYCTYSLYVSLTWHFHHTAVASVAVYCRDAGPVFTRCHISGTVPARHCSTCSYAQVCHNLNQLIVVTLSRAPLRDAVVTCHVSRPGWVTLAAALLTTGHEVMIIIPKYALLSGCLWHFLVSLTISNINIFRTWQSSEQSSAVWCVARPRLQRWPAQWDVWIKCWLGGILEFRHLTDFHSQNPRWLSMQVSPAPGHHAPPVPSPYTQILSFSVTHGAGWWDEDIRGQGVIISNPISSWSPHHHHQLPIAMKMELNVPGT